MELNTKAEIIDKLNQMRDSAYDNKEYEAFELLTVFYHWFLEKYVI